MHIQARVSVDTSAFADDDEESGSSISATYRRGALSEILRILEEQGFNLRSAGGHRIELGGEFGFSVAAREGDPNHTQATHAAVDVLKEEGFDVRVVEVQTRLLDDVPGALRAFVEDVGTGGLLIEEIAVGTPSEDGRIPVQIYTSRAGTPQQT
jgi:hypothetical protein